MGRTGRAVSRKYGTKERKKAAETVFNLITALLLFIFLFTLSTVIVLSCRPVYYLLIRIFDIEKTSGLDAAVIRENYDALIDYNMFFGPETLVFPSLPMSAHGAIHFMEVKRIFVGMQYAMMASLLLLVPAFIHAKRKKIYGFAKICAVFSAGVVVVFGAALALFWDTFFILFHKIAFQNDYWLFDPDLDPVITILPDSVFLTDAALILLLFAAGVAAVLLIFREKKGKHG